MDLWKIAADGPQKVSETDLKNENFLEENIEDWITNHPSLLGEPLLIIGRQVRIPEINDRLDILGLNPQGDAVIVELKVGKLKDPVDMQSLRYASYISRWGFEDFEREMSIFKNAVGNAEFNFNKEFEDFCSDAGVDEIPDINTDQRIILVGSDIKEKLGSVALWLYEHDIDIKVIEVGAFREDADVFIQPKAIVPQPVSKFSEVGKITKKEGATPWKTKGKSWHLEKRCSSKTKRMLLTLNDLILDNFDVSGPRWNQKLYVAYRIENYNWLAIKTHVTALILNLLVKPGSFNREELSKRLNIEKYDKTYSLSEKLGLPSSVNVESRSENWDGVILRIKEDFDLESERFLTFLTEAYEAFSKS